MEDLDDAIYGDDLLKRDAARHRIAEVADSSTISTLIGLLDAPHKATRRRAAAILGEIRPERAVPALSAALRNDAVPLRTRVAAARLLTVLSPAGAAALGEGLRHTEVRLRRACATPAAPPEALIAALGDEDPEVADEAAAALSEAEVPVPKGFSSPHATPGVLRLRAMTDGTDAVLVAAALAGDDVALDHLTDPAALQSLLMGPHRAAAAHALARLDLTDPTWATDPDPRVRAAAARGGLDLRDDPDPAVAWFSRRSFAPDPARTAPHARLNAPSAQPPYGIQPDDPIEEIERAEAALALCQPRFDINLGVAVRSAEAAGLREVFLVGRAGLFRSPARGTDRVIPVRPVADAAALVRLARESGYQIVAVQQTPASVPYHTADYPPRPLFVMGAEDRGVPALLREAADLLVEIPLFGAIDSLNVAAAATTVIFHWRCQTSGPR